MYRKIKQALKEKAKHLNRKDFPNTACDLGAVVLLYSKKGTYLVTDISEATFTVTCQRWLQSKDQKDRKEEHLWTDLKEVLEP